MNKYLIYDTVTFGDGRVFCIQSPMQANSMEEAQEKYIDKRNAVGAMIGTLTIQKV